jgi:hypothetical protein
VSSKTGTGGVDIKPRFRRVYGDRGQFSGHGRYTNAARHPRQRCLEDFVSRGIIPDLLRDGLVNVLGVERVHVPRVPLAALYSIECPGIRVQDVVVPIDGGLLRSHPVEHVVLVGFACLAKGYCAEC